MLNQNVTKTIFDVRMMVTHENSGQKLNEDVDLIVFFKMSYC